LTQAPEHGKGGGMYSLLVCTDRDGLAATVEGVCAGVGWRAERAKLDVRSGERIAQGDADAALLDLCESEEGLAGLCEVFAKTAPFLPLIFVLDRPVAADALSGFRYRIDMNHLGDLEHILISLSCSALSAAQIAEDGARPQANAPRILIVDDDAQLTSAMGHSLRSMERFDVQVANSGFQAGVILPSFHPDVAIVDISLGDVDGRDVCAFIKSHGRLQNTKVIGMSGYVAPGQALEQGLFDAFIEKPFRMGEVLGKVEAFLSGAFAK